MANNEQTCIHCAATVPAGASRCPVCGMHPEVGALVVQRHNPLVLPLRQLARPVAAGATLLAASAGLRLARRWLPRLWQRKPEKRELVKQEEPERGRVIAVRRRVWATGDRSGAQQWGAEETVWREVGE